MRSGVRASTRRSSRRSHSPYSRCARARSGRRRGATEPVDRLAVLLLGCGAGGHQRAAARLDSAGEVAAARSRRLDEPLERAAGEVRVSAACGRLDQLGQGPHRRSPGDVVRRRFSRRGGGLVVASEPVAQDSGAPLTARGDPLSLGVGELDCARHHGAEVGLPALQRPEPQQGVRRDVAARGGGGTFALPRQRSRPGEVAGPRARQRLLPEVERELGDRTRLAHELDLSGRDRMEAVHVPDQRACERRHPSPPQDVLDRDADELVRGTLQGRRGSRVPVGDQQPRGRRAADRADVGRRAAGECLHRAADLEEHALPCDASRRSPPRPTPPGTSRGRGPWQRARGRGPPSTGAGVRRFRSRRRRRRGPGRGPPSPARTRRSDVLRCSPGAGVQRRTRRPGSWPAPRRARAGRDGSGRRPARTPAGGMPRPPRVRREPARGRRSARALRPPPRSGPAVARERCHARRSGSVSGSVTSASARWTRWRSSLVAERYAADRTSGWANSTRAPTLSSPASTAGPIAATSSPSVSAARWRSTTSPSGSAAAASTRSRVSGGSSTRRWA